MPVTHIEEIAKHTADVTDAMFNGKRVIQYSPERYTLDETIAMAKKLEQSINRLVCSRNDPRGNLAEAMDSIATVIDDLIGHKKDI